MTILASLFGSIPYIEWPPFPLGWVGWLFLLGLTAAAIYRWRDARVSWDRRAWLIFAGLLLLTPLTNLFVGVRFPSAAALPLPGVPLEPTGPALMLLGAVPWILAGGLLGPIGAAAVGLAAGLLRGFWDTHSLFTVLEFAFLGVLFSALVRQRYRTLVYRLLQQPMLASTFLIPLYAILYVMDAYFNASGSAAARVDYALTNVNPALAAVGIEILVAGLISQVLLLAEPTLWGRRQVLQPSPAEKSLRTRFLYGMGTLILLLLFTLLISGWLIADNAARQMLRDRLASTAQTVAETVPFFLETGQNLAAQIAEDPALLAAPGDEMTETLGRQMRTVPFFSQLFILNNAGIAISGFPAGEVGSIVLTPEEQAGVQLAFSGVWNQTYSVPPSTEGRSAQIAFLAPIVDESGETVRVLLGRTELATNPFTRPLLKSLESMASMGGAGLLLDDNHRVLYDTSSPQVMVDYPGSLESEAAFFDDTAPDGTRNLVYSLPLAGKPWTVILKIPAQRSQQLALNIALPLSGMIFLLALLALVTLQVGLNVITTSIQSLSAEAMRIAQGNLDHPLEVKGVDEVGQLRRSFEQMRTSLQARLQELNSLLVASQGVASSLEMEDAIRPVLESVLTSGASSVRIALTPSALPEGFADLPSHFALGQSADRYAHMDEAILAVASQQERVVLSNVSRARSLDLGKDQPQPAALLAVALRHENRYYGVMWAAYDHTRSFSDGDINFLSTLAGQAALAAANTHLFLSAEIGRQRLAAILASTPDPVLVTDRQNRLLLANPAAMHTLGDGVGNGEGKAIDQVIEQPGLKEMLQLSAKDRQTLELNLPGGQTFLATASTVMADGNPMGRVCILRDVTHFKELDLMKSDFVSTVSHDLRSPLTLMRGYATMLEMVGDLNDQQKAYVRKIISGVENMARLVNDLLDLGRIEVGVGLQLESISVMEIVDRVTAALSTQASQKKITVSVDLISEIPQTIEADEALLQQAIFNLLENAVKYTRQGGRVVVRVGGITEGVLVEIEDTGIGIAPADIPRLFEKFYRGGHREARKEHGTGLGLAIVRSIAERHRGRVWVESQLGKGSTFFLLIPLRQSD